MWISVTSPMKSSSGLHGVKGEVAKLSLAKLYTRAMNDSSYVTTERVALAVYLLGQGTGLTARELAERLGVTCNATHKLLSKASRAVPLVSDGGKWTLLRGENDL